MELMKDEVGTVKKTEKVTYDPSKKYKWEHTDTFTMSGTDFGAIMQGLGTFLSIYGPPIKIAEKAYESAQNVLKSAVERGIANEITDTNGQES